MGGFTELEPPTSHSTAALFVKYTVDRSMAGIVEIRITNHFLKIFRKSF